MIWVQSALYHQTHKPWEELEKLSQGEMPSILCTSARIIVYSSYKNFFIRTWQTAHKMKVQRGQLSQDKVSFIISKINRTNILALDILLFMQKVYTETPSISGNLSKVDNERAKRYIGKKCSTYNNESSVLLNS